MRVSLNKSNVKRKHIAPKVYEEHVADLLFKTQVKTWFLPINYSLDVSFNIFKLCVELLELTQDICTCDYHFYRLHLLSMNVNLVTWYLSWIIIIRMIDNWDSSVNVNQFLFFVNFPTMVTCCSPRC